MLAASRWVGGGPIPATVEPADRPYFHSQDFFLAAQAFHVLPLTSRSLSDSQIRKADVVSDACGRRGALMSNDTSVFDGKIDICFPLHRRPPIQKRREIR